MRLNFAAWAAEVLAPDRNTLEEGPNANPRPGRRSRRLDRPDSLARSLDAGADRRIAFAREQLEFRNRGD